MDNISFPKPALPNAFFEKELTAKTKVNKITKGQSIKPGYSLTNEGIKACEILCKPVKIKKKSKKRKLSLVEQLMQQGSSHSTHEEYREQQQTKLRKELIVARKSKIETI